MMINTKKNFINSILLIIVIISLSGFTSAGLEILNKTTFDVEKTSGEETEIVFYLKNTENFPFYNVSFEDNEYIKMPESSSLDKFEPGTTAEIHAKVIGNEDFSGEIQIEGQYEAEIGQKNETYEVNVYYQDGITDSECDLNLVVGDSVKWINRVPDEIKINNAPDYLFGGDPYIPEGKNRTHTFQESDKFQYTFYRTSTFTDPCELNILPSEGLIINPDYSDSINLNLDVTYPPTKLKQKTPKTDYTLEINKKQEGYIEIENSGNNTAKGITLDGKWFSFSPNEFDLDPGYTKMVKYEILPYISKTEDTNKTYTHNVSIKGNFETLYQPFDIFIEYAKIGDGEMNESESLEDILEDFCEKNPELCRGETEYVYRNPNHSNVTFTTTQEDFNNFQKHVISSFDDEKEVNNFLKEETRGTRNITESLNQTIEKKYEGIAEDLHYLRQRTERNETYYLVSFIIFSTLGIGGLLTYIGFIMWKRRKFQYNILWQIPTAKNK